MLKWLRCLDHLPIHTKPESIEGEMVEFPSSDTPAIIAFKGLPATHKSRTAPLLAKWARSPVLWIEDFLAPDAGRSGDSASPSMNEALRDAFDALCKIAERQARDGEVKCVVIKSRLCTTFELDRLMDLMIRCEPHALLIIECQFSSEYRRRLHFEEDYLKDKHWYKLKSWNEVEVATDKYDAQAWDLHFENSIATLPYNKRHIVRRLVLDISYDGTWSGADDQRQIGADFSWVVADLLSKGTMVQQPNSVVYHDFRRALVERLMVAPREKSKSICTGEDRCIFKYREALEGEDRCRACEKSISGPGYECYKCNMVLHKSCAEEPTMVNKSEAIPYLDRRDKVANVGRFESPYYHFTAKHACDHCKTFSYECASCLLYTHLKCRLMPTIIKHDCDPGHFLQVHLEVGSETSFDYANSFACRGCQGRGYFNKYMCYVCGYDYHIRCVATPREAKHEHGGYEHVMRLMYSFDDAEEQDELWCDVCQKDMDSTAWFYRCKECPYYVSHIDYPSHLPCKNTGL